LLAGCQVVFPLEENAVCGGHGGNALFFECATSQRDELQQAGIRTGTDDPSDLADCDEVRAQSDLDRTEVCVIAADRVVLANTVIAGPRPLVLVAIDELRIIGLVTVTSRTELGAGANFAGCASGLAAGGGVGDGGGGGGAGGSFRTAGGSGGDADLDLSGGVGASAGVTISPLSFIRGGCPGSRGANAEPSIALGGSGGRSGGGLYLIAGQQLVVEGTIDASGEGGGGGAHGDTTGGGGGGGGGGSGGLIGLDAPSIVLEPTARLIANGGGGGGGGNSDDVDGLPRWRRRPDQRRAVPRRGWRRHRRGRWRRRR
jgi:hypothetical protein